MKLDIGKKKFSCVPSIKISIVQRSVTPGFADFTMKKIITAPGGSLP